MKFRWREDAFEDPADTYLYARTAIEYHLDNDPPVSNGGRKHQVLWATVDGDGTERWLVQVTTERDEPLIEKELLVDLVRARYAGR